MSRKKGKTIPLNTPTYTLQDVREGVASLSFKTIYDIRYNLILSSKTILVFFFFFWMDGWLVEISVP